LKTGVLFAFVMCILVGPVMAAQDRFALELEAGPVWQLRNDFGVPGDSGTLVRLDSDERSFNGRLTFIWNAGERWSVRVLATPLSTETTFTPDEDVSFDGENFESGAPVEVDYTFDSYRVGGFYRFPSSGRLSFRAGATLKLRDAEIALRNDARSASKTNTGVVPLLYGGVRWTISDRVAVDLDADAAAASQGRAEDVAIRVEGKISERMTIYSGGRVLDGGADNDEVYSFATFGYLIAGVRWQW
jgi:hypothetical protein